MPSSSFSNSEMPLHPTESISYIDLHLAALMQRLAKEKNRLLFLVATLTSCQTRAGHTCLDLNQLDNSDFLQGKLGEQYKDYQNITAGQVVTVLGKASVVGRPGDFKPLILDDNKRLYLKRYWDYQQLLADFVAQHAGEICTIPDIDLVRKQIQAYFPPGAEKINWQKAAAAAALLKRFCVITGGPGTGKTHTVAKILALLLEQNPQKQLRIKLAAPTGKAAVRLQESIVLGKRELRTTEEIKTAIPEEAATVHRLLGTIRFSPYFRHNAQNPLELDVLVVDEASMIDLALMAKLVEAIPKPARLILLGDNNQLASVEAGAVLADLSGEVPAGYSPDFGKQLAQVTDQPALHSFIQPHGPAIRDCVIQLEKSYRFESQQGIGALSRAVNAGDADQALTLLKSDTYPDIKWSRWGKNKLWSQIKVDDLCGMPDSGAEIFFKKFEKFRVLCAVREGPQGVRLLNLQIEQIVKQKNRIKTDQRWYAGQPILITKNDYNLNLFNGDIGLILPDPETGNELRVYFQAGDSAFRKLRPLRLPEHETAYTMTVHKSQGSEFERVLLLLPEQDSPVLTRELIYTAITRAAKKVEIWGNEEIFRAAVQRRIQRSSGLGDVLWGSKGREWTGSKGR